MHIINPMHTKELQPNLDIVENLYQKLTQEQDNQKKVDNHLIKR